MEDNRNRASNTNHHNITTQLTIWQWNCRGLYANQGELQSAITSATYKPDIICLQETHLSNNKTTPKLKDYNLNFHKYRTNGKKGGGLAIYVNNTITNTAEINTTTSSSENSIEHQGIIITLGTKKITIYNIYDTAHTNSSTVQDYTQITKDKTTNSIICGDFNAHNLEWGSDHTDTRGKYIEKFARDNQLLILNTGTPTRIDPATGKLSNIDLTIATTTIAQITDWNVLQHSTLGSDHFPICITIYINNPKEQLGNIPRWRTKKADWELFQAILSRKHIEDLHNTDTNQFYNNIIQAINEAAQESIPKSSGKTSKPNLPWWNEDCKSALKEKKKALNRFKHTKLSTDFIAYKRTEAKARRTIKEAKKASWQSYCSTLTHSTNTKEVWAKIKAIKGKAPNTTPPIAGTQTNQEKAEQLAKHFAHSSSNNNHTPTFMLQRQNLEQEYPHLFKDQIAEQEHNNSPLNDSFQLQEWTRALSNKKSTSPGEDNLGYEIYKQLNYQSTCS